MCFCSTPVAAAVSGMAGPVRRLHLRCTQFFQRAPRRFLLRLLLRASTAPRQRLAPLPGVVHFYSKFLAMVWSAFALHNIDRLPATVRLQIFLQRRLMVADGLSFLQLSLQFGNIRPNRMALHKNAR